MIPHDAVNIETDILAKYMESLLANQKSSSDSHLTITHLIEEGF
jgi:riboflavin synthase alpha subunit